MMTRDGVILTVGHWVARPNHRVEGVEGSGVWCNGSVFTYDPAYTGQRFSRTFGRSHHCECGEPMRDGDRVDAELYEIGRIVHVNCRERAAARP